MLLLVSPQNGKNAAASLAEAFRQHHDYPIITGFPGLADISGAIVLAEIGDDRRRFRDVRAHQAFAGSAPVTRASGLPTHSNGRPSPTAAAAGGR